MWDDPGFGNAISKQASNENQLLKYLFRYYSRMDLYKSLVADYRITHAGTTPSLYFFQCTYPRFPLWLFSPNDDPTVSLDLWKLFGKTPLTKTKLYEVLQESLAEVEHLIGDRWPCVVFRKAYVTLLAIHTLPRHEEHLDREAMRPRLSLPNSRTKPPTLYSIEPFESLLGSVGDGWID